LPTLLLLFTFLPPGTYTVAFTCEADKDQADHTTMANIS
jgi:hypothetical protein